MQVRQLHPLFAGEITGLDTSRPLSPESIAAVEQAMATYAVCVVRDASLSDADHPGSMDNDNGRTLAGHAGPPIADSRLAGRGAGK